MNDQSDHQSPSTPNSLRLCWQRACVGEDSGSASKHLPSPSVSNRNSQVPLNRTIFRGHWNQRTSEDMGIGYQAEASKETSTANCLDFKHGTCVACVTSTRSSFSNVQSTAHRKSLCASAGRCRKSMRRVCCRNPQFTNSMRC